MPPLGISDPPPARRGIASRLARLGRIAVAGLLVGGASSPAFSAEFEPEFRTLGLGQTAAELATEEYENFACGTNGGPPGQVLDGWTDFMQCAPEPSGLREVYVEFGTRVGRIAELFREQFGEELWLQQFGGTRMANFPVVLSLLFDEAGVVRGFRVVTDTRAPLEDRGRAYLLRFRVFPMYGDEGWTCIDRPPAPGETGVGDTYLNQVCTKSTEGKYVRVEAHFFRRPGQTGVDVNGQFVPGEFESLTRWEVFDASLPPQALPA
jgi:hypothetical protein